MGCVCDCGRLVVVVDVVQCVDVVVVGFVVEFCRKR